MIAVLIDTFDVVDLYPRETEFWLLQSCGLVRHAYLDILRL
jgi:hypothetical protein